jgi:ubiquinone/menaquinone biosynthesis C-methylase UbiE
VLEIGCGIGRIGRELAPKCRKWIGCDISSNMLKYAGKRLSHLKNIELVELPESNLSPIPDSSVDAVYCSVVFMHLDEWDRYEYVKEAYRVLRPSGRVYVDNFNLLTDEGWDFFMTHHSILSEERPAHISKSSTPQELEVYLIRADFENVKVDAKKLWICGFGEKIEENFN